MTMAPTPDPGRILALLDGGQRNEAAVALAEAFPGPPPPAIAPESVRFCHALHLLVTRSTRGITTGSVVPPEAGGAGAGGEEDRWEAGIRAVGAMLTAWTALTEGRVTDLVRESRRAAAELPRPMPWLELTLASLLQAAFRFSGDLEVHDDALDACRSVADQVGHPHVAVQARALMATVHLLRGSYHATLNLCDAALALAASAGIEDAPAAAMAHQFRGYVLFEWNRLDDARAALDRAWELAGSSSRGVGSGVARMSAQVAAALGDEEAAERWLRRLGAIVSEPMTLRNREWLTAVQVRHTLGRGDLQAVEDWVRTYDYRADSVSAAGEDDVLARLHELDHVLTMLELTGQWSALFAIVPRIREATAGRRTWFEARAAAAEAVALEGLGRRDAASESWLRAVEIGAEGSFVRLYLEGGDVRRGLVRRMGTHDGAEGRCAMLARACDAQGVRASAPVLTPKQLDVLALVAEGGSNKAIAQALGVSLSTVKTHLSEIFRRLGASSRTHALAEARRQGLLED